jgi:peptidoglycan/xylan/chitin deacetylase (PgdA/CDA1 family)
MKKFHHHKIVILSGHRISGQDLAEDDCPPLGFDVGIRAKNFEKFIRFMSREMHVVSLREITDFLLGKADVPDRAVAIMLDDGYMDNYRNAFPILKRYQVPATIFLVTGHVNTPSLFWWDRIGEILKRTRVIAFRTIEIKKIIGSRLDSLPDTLRVETLSQRNSVWERFTGSLRPCHPEQVAHVIEVMEKLLAVKSDAHPEHHLALTWDQVQEMHRSGIDFGAHTVSHPFLPSLSPDRLTAEVLGSKEAIEKHLGKPVTAFAYPYGELPSADFDIKRLLSDNGFQCAFLYKDGFVSKASNPFQLKRMGVGDISLGMMVREMTAVLTEDEG